MDERINNFVSYMEAIANDNSHGYAQDNRYGAPDYDCSSLVAEALRKNGFQVSKYSTTRDLHSQLLDLGWRDIDMESPRVRGDIFLAEGRHVVACVDANRIVHASINEFGGIENGQPGDQTGKEICITSYYNGNWDYHMRYITGAYEKPNAEVYEVGNVYTLKYNLSVRTGPSTAYRRKNHDELTADGQRNDPDGNGCLNSGTEVTCLALAVTGNDIWMQVPSGWCCAVENGDRYIE